MNLDGSAVLHADPERVWSVITDPAVLARTIPGCETLEQVGDDEYKMNVTVGVGAIRGTYAGDVRLSDQKLKHSRDCDLRADQNSRTSMNRAWEISLPLVSAYGCAGVCPTYSERQNAMQEARVIKSVMPSRCSELLALRDFGIGVRFNEIQGAVGREAKVNARVSIEPQCSVDAFRCSLNAGEYLRRKVLSRPIYNSHVLLITGIVFDLLGGDGLATHGAKV